MKKGKTIFGLLVFTFVILLACDKQNEPFNTPGGLLPTNYITIRDSAFSPTILTVANGNSITFLNSTSSAHTLISDDSTTLLSIPIQPDSSYFFKPDTATATPVNINIPYHCREHSYARGTIVLTQ